MSTTFTKEAYEEIWMTHQFRRTDGKGWLGSSETLTGTPDVAVLDADGDTVATMVSDVSALSDTKVKYKLKAGTAGETYTIRIRTGATSDGNKFEDNITLTVQ
jgi:hypothetical protein